MRTDHSVLCLILAVLATLCSCSPDVAEGARSLALHLADAEGQSVTDFVAVLSDKDDQTHRIICPSSPQNQPGLACTASGLRMDDPPLVLDITLKARGYEFATETLSVQELILQGRDAEMEIVLQKLAPFERNADYATGFEGEDGLSAFEQMAHEVDTDLGPTQAVKFYISDLGDAPRVFFQNTRKHPLHYDFARRVLGVPLSLSQFEAATYHGEGRAAMAGTLVRYPSMQTTSESIGQQVHAPTAVTFFPSDDLSPSQAALAHRLIEERLGFVSLSGGRSRLFYLPAGSVQESELDSALDSFRRSDVAWMVRRELFGEVSLQVLNPGLAYGMLKCVSPQELETTVFSYTDILVLTRLPNTLPVVGGTITEELQTPLAHVNVAARTRGTPNIALLDACEDARVAELLEKLVRFEVGEGTFSLREATLPEAQEFWANTRREPSIPPFDAELQGLLGFEELGFEDWVRVGAKAANLAELSRVLAERAPNGFAIPFYYYDRFMQTSRVTAELCAEARVDCVEEGRTSDICTRAEAFCLPPAVQAEEAIATESLWDYVDRLLQDTEFQRDSEFREAALDGLRHHIRHIPVDPDFGQALDQRVAELFGAAKVRLRSSTNAEDLPEFSGAGLYQSVSAFATGDKLASTQVRKVWASLWSFRAFEERAFWNIDHRAVRMGVAVHQAFPEEAANGVLITQNIADPMVAGMYVNVQLGEVPVTNPENGAVPEVFSIIPAPSFGTQVVRLAYSNLSPDTPILRDGEIAELYEAAQKVQDHFAKLYRQSPQLLALDLEFKFHGPERALFIKQARPFLNSSAFGGSAL